MTFVLLLAMFLTESVYAQLRCSELFLISTPQRQTEEKQSQNGIFGWIERLFEKSDSEKEVAALVKFKQNLKALSSYELKELFIEYAQESGVLFREDKNEFVILPDQNGSTLNKFVAAVNRLYSKHFRKEIRFVYDPLQQAGQFGAYNHKEVKVKLSLLSVYLGKPFITEAHEILHLLNDSKVKSGQDFLLRTLFSPRKHHYMLSPKFAYSEFLTAEEVMTYAADLRFLRRALKDVNKMSRSNRKFLYDFTREEIASLYQNDQIINSTLNEGFSYFSNKTDFLVISLTKFENGREYVLVSLPFVNRTTTIFVDQKIIQATKEYLKYPDVETKPLLYKDSNAYNVVLNAFMEKMEKLRSLNQSLIKISEEMNRRATEDQFLSSQDFFDMVDRYRDMIRNAVAVEHI